MDVRGVVVRFGGYQVYRFLFLTPAQATAGLAEDFRRTTYSLRPLSAAERADLRPQRIRLVAVNAGDTPETLARQMPFDDLPVERFRALNGLGPGQPLEAGNMVKIVVE